MKMSKKESVLQKLGDRIKYYRKQANMTQQELADSLKGIYKSGTAISLIESNARGVDASDLPVFAEVLGVNVSLLLGDSENVPDFSTALRSDKSLSSDQQAKIIDFYNYVKNR